VAVSSRRLYRRRQWAAAALAISAALGLAVKLHPVPAVPQIGDHLGGVFYVLFWAMLLFFLWPYPRAITPITLAVVLATFAVELSQKLELSWIEKLRIAFLGRVLLGHHFDMTDLPAYAIGGAFAFLLMHRIART